MLRLDIGPTNYYWTNCMAYRDKFA